MDFTGSMEEEEITKFNEWFAKNYKRLKILLKKFCWCSTYNWSDDTFHETYLNIISSIQNGKKLNYKTIDQYIFISFKNTLNKENALAYNNKRDLNYNSDNIFGVISGLTEDEDEKIADEEQFQRLYNFLCYVEKDIYASCGEEIGAVFSKKFDNQCLDIQNGDRKKFEVAKRYVRDNYTEYYNKIKKIKDDYEKKN